MNSYFDSNVRKFKRQSEFLMLLIQAEVKQWPARTVIMDKGQLVSVGGRIMPKDPPASRELTEEEMQIFLRGGIKNFADLNALRGKAKSNPEAEPQAGTEVKSETDPKADAETEAKAKTLIDLAMESINKALDNIQIPQQIIAVWNNIHVDEIKEQISTALGNVGRGAKTIFDNTIDAISRVLDNFPNSISGSLENIKQGIGDAVSTLTQYVVDNKKFFGCLYGLALIKTVAEIAASNVSAEIAIAEIAGVSAAFAGGTVALLIGFFVVGKTVESLINLILSRALKKRDSNNPDEAMRKEMAKGIKNAEVIVEVKKRIAEITEAAENSNQGNLKNTVDDLMNNLNENDRQKLVDSVRKGFNEQGFTGKSNQDPLVTTPETPVQDNPKIIVNDDLTKNINEPDTIASTTDFSNPNTKISAILDGFSTQRYTNLLFESPEAKETQQQISEILPSPESKKTFKDTINNFLRIAGDLDKGVKEVDDSFIKNASDFLDDANKVDIAEDFSNVKEVIGRSAGYKFITNVLESPIKGINGIVNATLKSIAKDNIKRLFLPDEAPSEKFANDFFKKSQKRYEAAIDERINDGILKTFENAEILFRGFPKKRNWWDTGNSSFTKSLTKDIQNYYANKESYIKSSPLTKDIKERIKQDLQKEIYDLIDIYKLQGINPFGKIDIPPFYRNIFPQQESGLEETITKDIEEYLKGNKSAIRDFQDKVNKELEKKYERILEQKTDEAIKKLISKYGLNIKPPNN